MKKLILDRSHSNPHFIGSWIIEPLSLCDNIVNYFEKNQGKQVYGVTGRGLDKTIKDRVDISIKPKEINLKENEVFKVYFDILFNCYKDYLRQWPYVKDIGSILKIGKFNIGRYRSGQHFQSIHTERASIDSLQRLFAFMTYLNDVEEGGSTYFTHYDLEIKPKKGLTIIWPAEWTHAHKGNLIKNGTKYIITGWMNLAK